VRISGGEWRSRRVAGPPARSPIRPTPDALREQGFAVLGPLLDGALFLDLFAGTGVNSLEALSRGASRAVLVDDSPAAAALIGRNFAALAVEETRWELVVRPAARAVRALAERGVRPGVVWCDPPFAEWELGPQALAGALGAGLLAPGARVVLELPPRRTVEIPGLAVARELRGAVLLRAAGLVAD